MTRTKIWRLSLAAILGFGWLFLTPAYSDDPLSLAAQEIQDLNNSIPNLNYKTEFKSLVKDAEYNYESAVNAKENRDQKNDAHNEAVEAEALALSEMNTAQSQVDEQTVVVSSALTNKNNAQDSLDIANVNLANAQNIIYSAGSSGVSFEIYPLSRYWNGIAYIAPGSGLMCQGSISSFNIWAGSGAICYASQNIIGIFRATLTVPANINDVYFAGYTDDGFRLYVDGVLETEQWQEQGAAWSPYTRHFDTSEDKTLELEAWWYNGGGPGSMHVGWGHSGIWTGIPAEYLSYGPGATEEQISLYNQALSEQQNAQEVYNDKLNVYNIENNKLIQYTQTLSEKQIAYQTAQQNTLNAFIDKNNASDIYDASILILNNSINKAWDYYYAQKEKEVQIAIAEALANQPQPTIDPTPEPTPEQTEPVEPTPTPEPETTPEATPTPDPTPEPSVEPSQEPSPQPTDTDPDPTPEPTEDPVVVPDKTNNSPVDEQTANLIADLTNSNTLTKLTPEQKATVASALGVRAEEIAKIASLAKSNETLATALEQFADRANSNLTAPMPYTLADATTEVATEAFLSDPLGAISDIDFEALLNFSDWGSDMTDDQREKAQEVIVPVVIAANIVAAAMTRRI